ncbi:MAG: protein translocase subunit SecF [Phycisphaerae bacterium]|nr:protein translocase subunit SecF [Phycisphaerae bacterium]
MVASEEIKGFAIVLMLGIVSSMFTALFATRVIFDFLTRTGVLHDRLMMLRLLRKPSINWMGLRPVFMAVSLSLIAGGLLVFFTRDESKNSKYDIEFTGGTSVQITLKDEFKNMTRDEVEALFRKEAENQGNSDLAAAKVYSTGESGLEYEITTTETNKTMATVTFNEGGRTVPAVQAEIAAAAEEANGTLYNLRVSTADNKVFTVSTSQVNKALVSSVLNRAFAEQAAISEPEVDEVVSHAVREAFAGRLQARQNLGLRVVGEEKITDDAVELADYIGGIKVTVELDEQATAGEMRSRIKEMRFKPDAEDLAWYRWELFSEDLAALNDEDTAKRFVYVTVYPEAGYRELGEEEWGRFVDNEKTKLMRAGSMETTLARVTQVDPSIGAQAKTQALIAIILSLAAIVAYIWIRFGTVSYGVAAIVALVHDVCITLGAVTVCTYLVGKPLGNALLLGDFKIDLQMIAAFLTIIGYSLNDTIVVFDRIRENRGKLAMLTPQMISESINQTLSRTLLTSFTTFMVVFIMYVWGGQGLRGFTFAMLVGIIVGTYSSIAIAAPILLLRNKADTSKLKK